MQPIAGYIPACVHSCKPPRLYSSTDAVGLSVVSEPAAVFATTVRTHLPLAGSIADIEPSILSVMDGVVTTTECAWFAGLCSGYEANGNKNVRELHCLTFGMCVEVLVVYFDF